MALKKCEKCGVFFGAENDENLCKNCRTPNRTKAVITGDIEYDRYINSRNIVFDNPRISPEDLVEAVKEKGIDINIDHIIKYILEGKLTLETGFIGSYCIKCGAKINDGTICAPCEMKMKFKEVDTEEEEKKHRGMFTR